MSIVHVALTLRCESVSCFKEYISHRGIKARDLTRILEIDATNTVNISMQLRLAAVQWLTANQPAFHPNLIGQFFKI